MKPLVRDRIGGVPEIDLTANELVAILLERSETETVCILDSCAVGHLGSHLLIAGVEPVEIIAVLHDDPLQTLALLDEKLTGDLAAVFTISYDFGMKVLNIPSRSKPLSSPREPDVFMALYDGLIVHDYGTGKTSLAPKTGRKAGIPARVAACGESNVRSFDAGLRFAHAGRDARVSANSNFADQDYLAAIETIKERIRAGDTYQTNLTQQLRVDLAAGASTTDVFQFLRQDHPAPFAAFINRPDSTVISASPERFFRVSGRRIETSPIKGTQRRGRMPAEDDALRRELLSSAKDRAENTMIVDLVRNDLGRVCGYGSVRVEKLCDIEEHPSLFHLVSTVSGELRRDARFSDILRAVFPCGSITGAPKISTMRIIDESETVNRGVSMGAIGYYVPPSWNSGLATFDLSVAIRTMVIRNNVATFNVGGGITIDSDPESEYDETLLKAKALLSALGAELGELSDASGV